MFVEGGFVDCDSTILVGSKATPEGGVLLWLDLSIHFHRGIEDSPRPHETDV